MTNKQTPRLPSQDEARAIALALLETTRDAYLSVDFTKFRNCVLLPQKISSFEGERLIETEAELKLSFDAMTESLKGMQIVDLQRDLISVAAQSADEIQITFETRYILQNLTMSEPIVGYVTISRTGDGWRLSASQYATTMTPISRIIGEGGGQP